VNETEIASALKVTLAAPRLAEAPSAPAPVETKIAAEELVKPTHYPDELSSYKLMDHFDLSREDRMITATKDQVAAIWQWGSKEAGSADSLDVLSKIRELEQRLGLTFREDDKLHALYRWIKLDTQRRYIEKEMALV
jgi:hypothetical protein